MSLLPVEIAPADPDSPAARACLAAYFQLLVERIPGVTASNVPDPDPDAAAYRPPSGSFLLALQGSTPLACVALKTALPGTGEVKRLWVAPAARGQGLARRMMAAIESRARDLGMHRLRLDTNEHLPEAVALYRALGWGAARPFTPFPATDWFEKTL